MKMIIDTDKETVEVGGNKISIELLRAFGRDGIKEGVPFVVVRRENDGTAIIENYNPIHKKGD